MTRVLHPFSVLVLTFIFIITTNHLDHHFFQTLSLQQCTISCSVFCTCSHGRKYSDLGPISLHVTILIHVISLYVACTIARYLFLQSFPFYAPPHLLDHVEVENAATSLLEASLYMRKMYSDCRVGRWCIYKG